MTVHDVSGKFGKTLAVLFLVAGLFLTGCSGPPDPVLGGKSPTATSTAPPKAPATATPDPIEAARPSTPAPVTDLLITATSLELRDASGTSLSTFDYFQPASELVAGLSTAFGSAPISERYEGGSEVPPGTGYIWSNILPADPKSPGPEGDFVLMDGVPGGTSPHEPNTWVKVSSSTVKGVHISTVDGISVGDDAAEIAARYPDTANPQGSRLDVFVGHVPLPPMDSLSELTFSVWLLAADPLGPITEFRSPSPNWGG
ncbi:hypothetical protein [Cryobacterium sp. TMT3-29-2]|uniref:hypothetical protein n=1 Tax=Cryobacterium sp. TMT3-29-2 TaxID=2555867 RepID=UPI001073C808|nr:hypothetical protein [Cryobacterium sp. TMT3-29-2]TFC85945.1 hypothetical protein E3O67_11480 [Cryobacterium sp. TMT3-29-2]